MALTINNETKNALAITNEDKGRDDTWNEATYTWNQASGTWDTQLTVITKETKINLTITNEAKN